MNTKKLTKISLLIGYSLILYIIESFMPNPLIVVFPGAKLGLTNIITLIAIIILDKKEVFVVITVRVLLSSIFSGPISSFLFSIAGAYLSFIFMLLARKIKGFSLIGVSVIGAIGHNIGQLLISSFILENIYIFSYLPFMLITSMVTGVFIGIVCNFMEKYLHNIVKNLY